MLLGIAALLLNGCTVAFSAAGGMLTPTDRVLVEVPERLQPGADVVITTSDSARTLGQWRGAEQTGTTTSLVIRDRRTRMEVRYNAAYVQRVERLDGARRRDMALVGAILGLALDAWMVNDAIGQMRKEARQEKQRWKDACVFCDLSYRARTGPPVR